MSQAFPPPQETPSAPGWPDRNGAGGSLGQEPAVATSGYVPTGSPVPAMPQPGGRDLRPGAERLPRPPHRRRAGMAGLAVLLVVGGAAVAGLLALRIDRRVPVVVARVHIPAGHRITAADLAAVPVSADGVELIPESDSGLAIGHYAGQDIPAGRLLDPAMLSETGVMRAGRAAVGVALKAGRAPASGLQAGDVVQVVRAVDGEPKVLSSNAVISSVRSPSGGAFGTSSGETPVATVVVDVADAPQVAAAAAADQLVLVLISRGGD